MPAADSALRDWPGSRRRARCPSTMRANVPAAGGQILLAVCLVACQGTAGLPFGRSADLLAGGQVMSRPADGLNSAVGLVARV